MVLSGNRTSNVFDTSVDGATVTEKRQPSQHVDLSDGNIEWERNADVSYQTNKNHKQENKRKVPKKYERTNSFQLEHRSPEEKRQRPYVPSDDARDVSGTQYPFQNQHQYPPLHIPSTMMAGRMNFSFEQVHQSRRQQFFYPGTYPYQPLPVSQPLPPARVHSDELSSAITLASMASESPSPVKTMATLSHYDLKDGDNLTVPCLQVPTKSLPNSSHTLKRNDCKSEEWICDFCHRAKFSSYEEACAHEEICIYNDSARKLEDNCNGEKRKSKALKVDCSSQRTLTKQASGPAGDSNPVQWFHGSIPLSVQPTDKEWLSDLNCYIRSHCVEAFSAKEG